MQVSPMLALIGGLGTPEVVLIFVVLLLLFGSKKLPELARGIGKSAGEFKRAREDFEREIKIGETDANKAASTASTATTSSPLNETPKA